MNQNKSLVRIHLKLGQIFDVLLDPILALIFALVIGAVIIIGLGGDVIIAYTALWNGAFGNIKSISQSLILATPLLFTGLSFAFAFKCGLFNIGSEGQLYVGAIAGAWAGYAITGIPSIFHILLVLLVGGLAGAIWGFIPGYLKVKLSVNEVINTIMLTYIAMHLTDWLVSSEGPLRLGSSLPATPFIAQSAKLPIIIPGMRLNIGFFIAVVVAFLVWIILWKTRLGYKIRAVGMNRTAAQFGGINSNRSITYSMMIAGALAGIGGAMEIISVHGRFYSGFSPGYGFEGIAVAMLGSNHPAGIVLAAILFGALKNGAMSMQIIAGTNSELVKVLEALIIFFVAGKWSIMTYIKKINQKKEDKNLLIGEGEAWKSSQDS
ncbi:MAG: ABC transporter permease [Candidatus Amoebophilus sp.]